MLFLLVLSTGRSLFLAVITEAAATMYVFALAFLALAGYLYLLGQTRERDGSDRTWTREPPGPHRWLDVADASPRDPTLPVKWCRTTRTGL